MSARIFKTIHVHHPVLFWREINKGFIILQQDRKQLVFTHGQTFLNWTNQLGKINPSASWTAQCLACDETPPDQYPIISLLRSVRVAIHLEGCLLIHLIHHKCPKCYWLVSYLSLLVHICLFKKVISLRLNLRMFAPIVSAHRYCARKFTCHVMHQACAPSSKMNNDRVDGHCYSFAWI